MSSSQTNSHSNNEAHPPAIVAGTPQASGTPVIGISQKPSALRSAKRRRLNFDDEEKTDDAGNVVPTKNTAYVIFIKPQECRYEIRGAAIVPTEKYADAVMSAPLFVKATDERKDEYVESLDIIKRVVSCKRNGTPIGNVASGRFYPTRSLCFTVPDVWEIKNVIEHVNNVVYENSKTFFELHKDDPDKISKFYIKGSQYPYIATPSDPENVWTVELWCDACSDWKDIVFAITHELKKVAEQEKSDPITFQKWLKMDPKHMYTLFREGEVPVDMIHQKNLKAEHMKHVDFQRYIDWLTGVQAAKDKKKAAAASTPSA